MVKRTKKRQKKLVTSRKSKAMEAMDYSAKEKIILVFFLVFTILVITILFKAPVEEKYVPITAKATVISELTKTSYDPNEKFNGSVKLQLQQGDVLSGNRTEIYFLIYTNKPKCSKYLCDNNIPIEWYAYDETTGDCYVKDADPEGTCCLLLKQQCRQIILNSGFETELYTKTWKPSISGGASLPYSEFETQRESIVLVTDSSDIYPTEGRSAVYQDLTAYNRATPISAFKKTRGTSKISAQQGTSSSDIAPSAPGAPTPDPLEWKVLYDLYGWLKGCAFEVIIKSTQGRNLHYWYSVNSTACPKPIDTATDRYVIKTLPSSEGNWSDESADLYKDWTGPGINPWPETDVIKEIWLVSHGKYGTYPNAQIVRWDDVRLTKTIGIQTPTQNQCEARGRKCCPEGSGLGDYFENLECPKGKECWSECTNYRQMTLDAFRKYSTTPDKYNRTFNIFTYIKDPSEQTLEETQSIPRRCEDSTCTLMYDYGSGYTACLDTSENAPRSCRNWDNSYELLLEDVRNFKTPGENGTYELAVKIQYKPTRGDCGYILNETYQPEYLDTCVMYEIHEPFTVGEVCEPTWQCTEWQPYPCTDKQTRNCTDVSCGLGTKTYERDCCVENWSCGDWSACQPDGTRKRTCVDLNNCSTTYTLNDTWYDPTCAALPPCTESDWDCSEWQPAVCPESGYQTRTCTLIGTCDESIGYVPEETKTCIPPTPEKPKLGWLVYVLIAIIIVAAVVFIMKQFILGKPKKTKQAYPELVNYIKDALATGATKAEIRTKLLEAGWPKDAIDASFKAVKK